MRIVKRRRNRVAYDVRDKVRTAHGEGVINHVFPQGAYGKRTYSVKIDSKRIGIIFSEDELTFIEKGDFSI